MRHFISLTSYVRFRTSKSVAATTFCQKTQHISKWFAFPLVALAAGLLLARPCAATPFQWEYTGSLKTARFHHTATLLPDGRVLVAGGEDRTDALASAELYDLAAGTWSDTASLSTARDSHTATLLPNGMVLVAGGKETDISLASAELYDPATGTWSTTGSLDTGRIWHTATLLLNGKVLVAGGSDAHFVQLVSAELYDPATGTWSPTGSLNIARYDHTATLLPNGMVLVAGGNPGDLDSAELYDPATGTWSLTGSLNDGRGDHVAILLPTGMVLVADGTSWDLSTAELYDPAVGTWSLTGSLNTPRKDHTATLLPNGTVLVTGGAVRAKLPLASAELYDPGIVATKVDGRGTFDNQENEVTFNFHANQPEDGSTLGYYSFCDPAAGVCITKGKTESLSITGINAEFSGKARLEDGTRVTFDVSVTDNGEPGILDTISITLSNGYSAGGTLTSGDIRIY
jgi:Galactose oxidase, central domain/Kelch motif